MKKIKKIKKKKKTGRKTGEKKLTSVMNTRKK